MLCCGFVVLGFVLAVVVCMCVRGCGGDLVFSVRICQRRRYWRGLSVQESRTTIRTPTNPITTQGPHKTCPLPSPRPPPKKNKHTYVLPPRGDRQAMLPLHMALEGNHPENMIRDEARAQEFWISCFWLPLFDGDGVGWCFVVFGSVVVV